MLRPRHARRDVSEDQIVPTVIRHQSIRRSQIHAHLPLFQRNEIANLHSHPFLISVFENLLPAGVICAHAFDDVIAQLAQLFAQLARIIFDVSEATALFFHEYLCCVWESMSEENH